MKSKKHLFLLSIIIFLAFLLRFFKLNWDQNQHLHPDERFLTMVLTEIKIPSSFFNYINPQVSTLNPYNKNFPFFVYGSFPLNFVKIISHILNVNDYNQINLVGRFITIIADTIVVFFIYLISKKIFNNRVALLSSFFYSIYVLPIQLSHFFTVDPFLNLFLVISFYVLLGFKQNINNLSKIILLSFFFAVAMACKISAIYFLPVIAISFVFFFFKKPRLFFSYGFVFIVLVYVFFRLNQPQAFTDANFFNLHLNPQFLSNLKDLKSYDNNPNYPPSIQWIKTVPLVFPIKNIILWGLGIPFGLIFIASIVYNLWSLTKKKSLFGKFSLSILLFWIISLFFLQGSQSVTTMRYFLPIYPFIAIISASFAVFLLEKFSVFKNTKILVLFFLILLIYPFSFLSIYTNEHTRILASRWIFQNIPPASVLGVEYWDDSLPLSLNSENSGIFKYETLSVATPDDSQKITALKNQLSKVDYIILSSGRFYLTIPKNPEIFPQTSKYYQSLFDGSLGFRLISQFESQPCFPPSQKPLFCFNDSNSEEAFSVYDHPKVYIFKKTSSFNLDSF